MYSRSKTKSWSQARTRVDRCCARSMRSQRVRRDPASSALKLKNYNRSYSNESSVTSQRKNWLRRSQTKKREQAQVLAVMRDRGDLIEHVRRFPPSSALKLEQYSRSHQYNHRFCCSAKNGCAVIKLRNACRRRHTSGKVAIALSK
jgi:hypothetical protein